MARLVVKHGGILRLLADIKVSTHDGSIILSLIRSGTNTSGWMWDSTRTDFDTVQYPQGRRKTKKITIHASGRVNYHGLLNPGVNFIPCLLDLTEAMLIVLYVVPVFAALDLVGDIRTDDHVVEMVDGAGETLGFEFSVMPSHLAPSPGEIWRFIIEGRYGLTCVATPGAFLRVPPGVPAAAFCFVRPSSFLTEQSLPEDEAFIRFQELMHANQIRQALMSSRIPKDIHDQIINETVRMGRGIQGPNGEGVWEIVCTVAMRIRPVLTVQFSNPRYRAELIDMQAVDVRLERVRVRFKVFDQQEQKWVKHPVEILGASLDAEL